MALILAYRNRGLKRNITIVDADGATITPGANDLIRATIGRKGETPKFAVTSGTDSLAGSSFTKGAVNTLRLDATDLNFEAGTYTMFIDFVDNADAAETKNVSRQTFSLQEDFI